MLGVEYPVQRLLKNDSVEQLKVMTVTEIQTGPRQNDPVMARRSFGVVLIVALLGWTVNQPILGCEGQHSRAAVAALAGASPAYQPEPSPTRHSCCPRESQPPAGSHNHSCPHQISPHSDCCSVTNQVPRGVLPALLKESPLAKCALHPLPSYEPIPPAEESLTVDIRGSAGVSVSSFIVLRL